MARLTSEQEERLVALLAIVYRAVPWGRLGTRNVWDVWNHRVRAAAAAETMGAFVSRLCNWFGIQSLPPEHLDLVDHLVPDTRAALEALYREHIPLCMRAVLRVRAEKEARRGDKKKAEQIGFLDPT